VSVPKAVVAQLRLQAFTFSSSKQGNVRDVIRFPRTPKRAAF